MDSTERKFNITETIRDIRKAREDLRHAVQVENTLCTPMLNDYDLLPKLYQMFCDLSEDVPVSNVESRKIFIFIIQYLYAPRNLFGYKMPRGLRRRLAEITGLNAVSPVSRGASETLHHYQVYTQFREEVNRIFGGMVDVMRQEGII